MHYKTAIVQDSNGLELPGALATTGIAKPVVSLITLYHCVLYEGIIPSLALVAGTFVLSVEIFVIGYAIFLRCEALYAEVI